MCVSVCILNIGYLVDSLFFQRFEFLISLTSGLHCFMDAHIYVSVYFSLAAFKIFCLSLSISGLIMSEYPSLYICPAWDLLSF